MSIEQRFKKSKSLKVAVICFAEMGHIIPAINIADLLVERGHDVYFITNDYNK